MDVLTWFDLPTACKVDVPITKTALKQQDGITSGEAKLLDGPAVQSIRLLGVLSKARANIEEVQTAEQSFVEIYLIRIQLVEASYAKMCKPIARLLHKLIPHHSIIIAQTDSGTLSHLSLANKHIHKGDSRQRVLQDEITSEEINADVPLGFREALAFAQADKTNLQTLYRYYGNVLHNYNLVAVTEEFKLRPYIQTREMVLAKEEIQAYESRISQLQKALNKAQMREKVQLNTEIHELKEKIQKHKDQLK